MLNLSLRELAHAQQPRTRRDLIPVRLPDLRGREWQPPAIVVQQVPACPQVKGCQSFQGSGHALMPTREGLLQFPELGSCSDEKMSKQVQRTPARSLVQEVNPSAPWPDDIAEKMGTFTESGSHCPSSLHMDILAGWSLRT